MSELLSNLRYALRGMRRNPALFVAIVLTLGLGIGANVAIFAVVNVALFRPLPFADEERLVRIFLEPEDGSVHLSPGATPFLFVRRHARSFSTIAGQRYTSLTLTTDRGPERIVGIGVTEGWSEALGVAPAVGRDFTPEEEKQGWASGVVLLSDAAWHKRFGGDRSVLGRTLRLDGESRTVVGVMPPGLTFPYETELWFPLDAERDSRGPWSFNIPARLAPGVTPAQMRADLDRVTAAARREIADQVEGLHFTAMPMREEIVGGEERRVLALEAAVGFLLLIVCANVGHLLVARASGRRRELAIRVSLGADRWRLRAQLLSESLLLGLLGGALGLVMVVVTAPLLEPLIPGDLAQEVVDGVPVDLRVAAVAVAASVVASFLFGALPALLLSSPEPKSALGSGRSGAPDRGTLRLGRGLVIGEIALSLALLSGTALLLRDFQRVNGADLGYPAENLLTFRLTLDEQRYPTGEARGRLWSRLVEDVSDLPGLKAAGVTSIFPSRHGNTLSGVEVEGRPLGPGEQRLVNRRAVSPTLLETLGLHLVRGRQLEEGDRAESPPVVVVSQRMAERFWPGEEAVGRRFRDSRRGPQAPWLTVVGVVSDLREAYDEGDGTIYLPMAQSLDSNDALEATLVARVAAAPAASAQAIREAVRKLDPELPLYSQATALELHAEAISQQRGAATVATAFAALGLIVALVGVYAAMAHSVARRQKEIGVRVALGCGRAGILGSVLGQGARMVAAGCLLGGVGAIALGRYLASVLSELDGFDPMGFLATLTVVAASALVACLLPAWRATRVDPVRALRAE